ncbi:hypothetical protein DSO57_1023527 [Entomophthora muscae]|uniref:Uncharacterized protein n=1 Tax=Entomophthora muscae TaxID=34485 RepID=A0ACC2UMS4_9FUNG|nr:hypothetical protein DSO57_1023527 [Entomophthora muscae]
MHLPLFILEEVLSYLNPIDLFTLRLVAKRWNFVIDKWLYVTWPLRSDSSGGKDLSLFRKYGKSCKSFFFCHRLYHKFNFAPQALENIFSLTPKVTSVYICANKDEASNLVIPTKCLEIFKPSIFLL